MISLDFLDQVYEPERVPPGATVESDAIVVGTGAGGAVVAAELQQAGLSVVMLEEGAYFTARDYGHSTPLEAVRMLYRKSGMTFTVGNQSVLLPAGRCVGGTTVINQGTSLRAVPESVERWRSEFGLADLARDIDDLYARVEQVQGVKRIPDRLFGRHGELFKLGTERTGHTGEVISRNERGCRGAARCFLGCPNDAKQAVHLSYVPRALRAGARLHVRARVRKILVEGRRAAGVVTRKNVFRAPVVVVAAGAMYTPLLLRGCGGRGRGLGRHLKMHPAVRAIGLFDEDIRGWSGTGTPQGWHLVDTLAEGISIEGIQLPPTVMGPSLPDFGAALGDVMLNYGRLLPLGVRTIEDTEGRVFPSLSSWPILWYWLRRSDVDRLTRGAAIAAEILFAAGATKVFTGHRGFEELRTMDDVRRLKAARLGATDMEVSAYHAQGTARMADSPEKGPCDPTGQVWGVEGLYAADGSSMPATPVINPQLSIMAFATHVARSILARGGRSLSLSPQLLTSTS